MSTPLLDDATPYTSKEWDFQLAIPHGWEIYFENEGDYMWQLPVCLSGPPGPRAPSGIILQVRLVQAEGTGIDLDGYMAKAESDLRGFWSDFTPLRKWHAPILEAPAAWMTYSYTGDSGQRQELNATAFFGRGKILVFQFICETDRELAEKNFPLFEAVIESLKFGPLGLRLPHVHLTGVSSCAVCSRPFQAGDRPNSFFDLEQQGLMAICDACRQSP